MQTELRRQQVSMADEIVEQLKQKLDASTDSELARKLGVDRRTVSGWRSRGSVPKRYLGILEGVSKNAYSAPPSVWGEYETVAFDLALFRFCNFYGSRLATSDFRHLLADLPMCAPGFWVLMNRAQEDLANALDEGTRNLHVAFAMLMHDDLTDIEGSVRRDEDHLTFRKLKEE